MIWHDGGKVDGLIVMGADNDTALLKNLNEAIAVALPRWWTVERRTIPLTFDNTQATHTATLYRTGNM